MTKAKSMFSFAVLAILSGHVPARTAAAQSAPTRIFLVSDRPGKQWCAYTNEASWKSKVDSSEAAIVATLNYSDSRLTSIDVTTEDEAGDWTVLDHYTVTEMETLGQLERRANIVPGHRSVLEKYALDDGKAKLKSRETRDLTSGEKLNGGETWLPKVRVAMRVADFQFASLAHLKYSEIISKGTVCAAARQVAR